MTKKNIDSDLQQQIREHLLYYWKATDDQQEQNEVKIISQLSDSLKEKLFYQANKVVLNDNKVFSSKFSQDFLKKTIPIIQEIKCSPEQVLYVQGDTDENSIYFIESGEVEVYF